MIKVIKNKRWRVEDETGKILSMHHYKKDAVKEKKKIELKEQIEKGEKEFFKNRESIKPLRGFELYKFCMSKTKKFSSRSKKERKEILEEISRWPIEKVTLENLLCFGLGFDSYNDFPGNPKIHKTIGTLGPGGHSWEDFYKENDDEKQSLWKHWLENKIISTCRY